MDELGNTTRYLESGHILHKCINIYKRLPIRFDGEIEMKVKVIMLVLLLIVISFIGLNKLYYRTDATVFSSDDFDSIPPVNWLPTGYWHLVNETVDPCIGSGGHPSGSFSSPNSYAYHITTTCNYDDGTTNAGELTSPSIDLSGTNIAWLHFWTWFETDGVTGSDTKWIEITPDGINWTPLIQIEDSLGSYMKTWFQVDIDISTWTNDSSVWIRFRFDTVSPLNNSFAGWYVDEVVIESIPKESPSNVALFRDVDPWKTTANEDVLDYFGIPYTKFTSTDIGIIDLEPFDKVIIAGDQTNAFYAAAEANIYWFESYVESGGVLEIHATDNGRNFGAWPTGTLPGDFKYTFNGGENTIGIIDPTHRMMSVTNNITLAELQGWHYSNHGSLTIPSGATVVLDNGASNITLATSISGFGGYIVSTQTLEFAYGAPPGIPMMSLFLENVILYMPQVNRPPIVEVWKPGDSPTQTYVQGDIINVTWTATDNHPLPVNPINITYGYPGNWTTIETNEKNDGTYLWDTTAVPCPGTYWINLSVYDSIGQTIFDESNYSFEISCPDNSPMIEVLEPGGIFGQTFYQGSLITVLWIANDDRLLPSNPINISYGLTSSWKILSTNEVNDGTYSWNTSDVLCPGTYWMNLSIFDSIGQTTFDESNYSFDIGCPPDSPPEIETWNPGDKSGQTYTQGDTIEVTWRASDDKPLSLNSIGITYGVAPVWNVITAKEVNDGKYLWDTSVVSCPGTYWMNLSVVDSIGQTTFDVGNYSFDLECRMSYPPIIDNVESSPNPQIIGSTVTISATITDVDTVFNELITFINIIDPEGMSSGNFTMTCDLAGMCTYSFSYGLKGNYTFRIWVIDTDGNLDTEIGEFTLVLPAKEHTPASRVHNWKPIIALIFTIILTIIGTLVSYKWPIRIKGILRRDRLYTFLGCVLPFVIAEIATGLISLCWGLLIIPPILGVGLALNLFILIAGLISCIVIQKKYDSSNS